MSGTYEPELYDVITPPQFLGDVDWYRSRAVEAAGPVLELGAGTGRITIPIAEAGVEIHALDAHAGMLQRLRTKLGTLDTDVRDRVTVVEANMADFQLDCRFGLVMIPYRAFLHNHTEEDQLGCLRSIRNHLRARGKLAFNVFHPSLKFMAEHAGSLAGVWRWTEMHDLPDGRRLVRSEANQYDTVRQVVHSQHRYEIFDGGGELERTFLHKLELAYLYPGDIRRLLELAGFVAVNICGGFGGQPFDKDGDELVVQASVGGSGA